MINPTSVNTTLRGSDSLDCEIVLVLVEAGSGSQSTHNLAGERSRSEKVPVRIVQPQFPSSTPHSHTEAIAGQAVDACAGRDAVEAVIAAGKIADPEIGCIRISQKEDHRVRAVGT